LTALCKVVPAAEVIACIPVTTTAETLVARLRQLLGQVWPPRWRKEVNRQPRPHQPKAKGGDPTSVHRLQEAHRQKQLNADPKT
jgi:hypothetical protein